MSEQQIKTKLFEKLESYRSDMVDFQKSVTRIRALSPQAGGEGEWDKTMYIKKFLEEKGISTIQQIDAPDPDAKNGKRPSLVVKLEGNSSDKTIWIMAHTDVVPAGDLKLWSTDPFEAIEKDGKLFGRGTEDNQQSLTSAVFTALAFHSLKIKPAFNLNFLLVADEETGSEYGLHYILKNFPELFGKDDIIIVPDAGEPDSGMLEVAEKGIAWIKFTTTGKQCHASVPHQGVNAFKAASNLVVKLDQLHEIFDSKNNVFDVIYSTFEPTKKEANVPNINTIPGEDIFYLDCRLLPEYKVDTLLAQVRQICDKVEKEFGVSISYQLLQKEDAAPATPTDSEVVVKLQEAIGEIYKINAKPLGIGGGTVAAIFRRAGFNAAVWSTIADVCHQPNEYCIIDNMVNDAKVFAHVCLQK